MKPTESQRKSNQNYQERRRRKLGVLSRKKIQKATELYFIAESNKVHKNRYDYSMVFYKNATQKVEILCPIHGKFTQTPDAHKRGQGCPLCAQENRNHTRKRKTIKQFIQEANQRHGDQYSYDNTKYINIKTKVVITCKYHGDFSQEAKAHLNGQGCPDCANIRRASFFESKGEREIEKYFIDNNIQYIKQKTFSTCKFKMLLRFDFYLPTYNMLIEYDGEQHYKFVPKFHGTVDGFVVQQARDGVKTEYAKSNNISLVRIRWDQNIQDILVTIIN